MMISDLQFISKDVQNHNIVRLCFYGNSKKKIFIQIVIDFCVFIKITFCDLKFFIQISRNFIIHLTQYNQHKYVLSFIIMQIYINSVISRIFWI